MKINMLKVAIVGCGKIADSHASSIRRIQGCEIVAACDREPLMARQFAERFGVKQHFCDLEDVISTACPDVVHITTPPQTHRDLAMLCLDAGCHVYVEKPFTLCESHARELIALANRKRRKITAGHDDQFSHVSRRMRALVQAGFLGGHPVHVESYYCYELGGSYVAAVLGDKEHWVRKLPGKLLQNIISHGIARISEFIQSEAPHVVACGYVSPFLKSKNESEIIDELRVIISEEERMTAYFTFSSQVRPSLHEFRIYGPKNGLIVDQDQETLIRLRGAPFPSYAEKFVPPMLFAGQYLGNISTNLRRFFSNDFHMKSGMKFLIESFYRSIVEDTPVPIPYREIILTAKIMDAIFAQLDSQQKDVRESFRTTLTRHR